MPDGSRLTDSGLVYPSNPNIGIYDVDTIGTTAQPDAPIFAFWAKPRRWTGDGFVKTQMTHKDTLKELDLPLDFTTVPEDATPILGESTIIPAQPTTLASSFGVVAGTHLCVTYSHGNGYCVC